MSQMWTKRLSIGLAVVLLIAVTLCARVQGGERSDLRTL